MFRHRPGSLRDCVLIFHASLQISEILRCLVFGKKCYYKNGEKLVKDFGQLLMKLNKYRSCIMQKQVLISPSSSYQKKTWLALDQPSFGLTWIRKLYYVVSKDNSVHFV